MKIIGVSGSGTGVGKTVLTAALAAFFAARGMRVGIVKPLQSGGDCDAQSARESALRLLAGKKNCAPIEAHTLFSFAQAKAPVVAAQNEGRQVRMERLLEAFFALPRYDVCLAEGAGGLLSPCAQIPSDWRDFFRAAKADFVALSVVQALGCVHQARAAFEGLSRFGLRGGVFLNVRRNAAASFSDENEALLRAFGVPLWGELQEGGLLRVFPDFSSSAPGGAPRV